MQIIDRRLNSKNKSAINRERFLKRYREQIRQSVTRAIKERKISDIEQTDKVPVPVKDMAEPQFSHGRGGVWDRVHPGNQDYVKGDRIARPPSNPSGKPGQAGNSDEPQEDDFVFELSREEFMRYFFEDLALPNLVKRHLSGAQVFKTVRMGYTTDGTPNNIDVLRTLRQALARRIAFSAPLRPRLEAVALAIEQQQNLAQPLDPEQAATLARLQAEQAQLQRRRQQAPFIDPVDLRYSHRVRVPQPSSRAVMFCVMDVSGSMDEAKKDIAKRFFILLYLFLTRNYQQIELVFIRHHTQAKEVDEDDFFTSRESGGTVVSSAISLVQTIVQERYTEAWNIYVAQASDGDNWDDDSPRSQSLLRALLPALQYFAYIEITAGEPQSLWHHYAALQSEFAHLAMQRLSQPSEIYPVFRELFKKEAA